MTCPNCNEDSMVLNEEEGVASCEVCQHEYYPNQKRVKLKHGTARVNENCPEETIKALSKMSEIAYKTK